MSEELDLHPDAEDEHDIEAEAADEGLSEAAGNSPARRNNLATYLKSIGAIDRLGRDEQMALAFRIREMSVLCVSEMLKTAARRPCRTLAAKPLKVSESDHVRVCRSHILMKLLREDRTRVVCDEEAERLLTETGEEADRRVLQQLDEERAWQILSDHTNLLGVFLPKKQARRAIADFNRFYEANLRLAVSVASKFGKMFPLADRIQNGNLGLAKAIIRYDPGTGNQFSGYATFWIRHMVTRAIEDRGRVIRLPVHCQNMQSKVTGAQARHMAKHGCMPTPAEIAKAIGKDVDIVVNHLAAYCQEPISLATPILFGKGSAAFAVDITIEDTVVSSKSFDPTEAIEQVETIRIVHECIRQLPERMQLVIRKRFNFTEKLEEADDDFTLAQVGKEIKVKHERVRQIQVEALELLRLKLKRRGVDGIPF